MRWNNTFQCLILSNKFRVGPKKIGSFGEAETMGFFFMALLYMYAENHLYDTDL